MWFHDFMTNENNITLPKSEYLYGTRHIITLILTAILTVAIYFIFRNKSEKAKNILFKCFGFFFLFWEVSTRIVNLIIAESLTATKVFEILLPMHICSVMVWIFIIAIFAALVGSSENSPIALLMILLTIIVYVLMFIVMLLVPMIW